jgi:hypothetical protein
MNENVKNFFVAAALVGSPPLVINGLTATGFGPWRTPGIELLALPIFIGMTIFPFSIIALIYSRYRSSAKEVAAVCTGMVLGGLVGNMAGGELRMYAFELAAARAAPLVDAIEAYERQHGAPPEQLSLLVPTFLQSLPDGLPQIEIAIGDTARKRYLGNSWALAAAVPRGFLNWDEFIYLPNQNYPSSDLGGTIERLGSWGYVHE